MAEAVDFSVDGHIATVTLDRPDKMNAINRAMRAELWKAYTEIKENREIFVGIITGAGKAFCAGKDLLEKPGPEDVGIPSNDDIYVLQRYLFKPLIAAINGPCLAQGGGLALLCDIRVMADTAVLGWPQVRRGISSVSGPTLFAREVGLGAAMPFILRGVPVTAEEAKALHVAHEVTSGEELLQAANRWAQEIMEAAPTAVQGMKESAVRCQEALGLEARIEIARGVSNRVLKSDDSKEGVLAFKEKRPPVWSGR